MSPNGCPREYRGGGLAASPTARAWPSDPLTAEPTQHLAGPELLQDLREQTSDLALPPQPPEQGETPGGAPQPPPPGPTKPPSPSAATPSELAGPAIPPGSATPLAEPPGAASPGLELAPGCEWEVCTTQGGIFFLLNALAWEGYQERLQDWGDPGGGWRLLWRLGLALGCRPDAGLEAFLLREGALDERGLRGLVPLADPLARLGALRFGPGVWNEALFALPARVRVTRSHVDAHFRLEDVRLEIRRAGLDLNPGWLPWLGRVVTFHFGSGLEPEQP